MEGAASNKFKNCSLGMKQRIGIAMALLGRPRLLVLDEPINGLDADGMRIMREVLTDVTRNEGSTVLISSHILGELEKIATHYGIIRHGKMIRQMTAAELDADCPTYLSVQVKDTQRAKTVLQTLYRRVKEDESRSISIYDDVPAEEIVSGLYEQKIIIGGIHRDRIGLEEYYTNLMEKERR